eukprot:m51a1_g2344 cad protein, putative (2177) ;mRNA; f:563303-570346
MSKARLVLDDGTVYEGESFGADRSVSGECVFQTGMVGYVESLTDPSYRGQILVLAYPLAGNYGVPPESHFESSRIHAAALVVLDYSEAHSHWLAQSSLGDWLKSQGVPALCAVDTRAVIKRIRDRGAMLGKVLMPAAKDEDVAFADPNLRNLVAEVSVSAPEVHNEAGDLTVAVVDCGMKRNQLRCLESRGVRVRVLPWNHDFLADDAWDALFLSNGPGNPTVVQQTICTLRKVLERESARPKPRPIFGICLGNQLLALAAGASTYKLKFGNRGQNQPCVDCRTGRCHLTMQNHGFAVDVNTLPQGWKQLFYNANDGTNEGIAHETLPFFSVQFHPEAHGGPNETDYLFDCFVELARGHQFRHPLALPYKAPERKRVSKVLVLGSGGLSIGQAGEFDYSGSQAIKALKEEGVKTVLVNPNIATVQTSPGLADKLYFVPVTADEVAKVIEAERPDGLLLQFGGQTALNCGIELHKRGVLERYGLAVLGTPVEVIIDTEDRELFAKRLLEINEKIAPSSAARTLQEALDAAARIGYPVIVRAGFALGGLGSGFASGPEQLVPLVTQALAGSEQVLIERSLKGWKEVEYEVVRDAYDNCVTVCNMENLDPLGIHTGESIVVAPSQTLSDADYHMLRRTALRVVRHLGIVGECNIQYALDPCSETYYIIEVNARLSRSSALASKATGYPLAFVAAKLALGHPLPELRNAVTKVTTACWEPSLDYVVVKVPRWDLKKFQRVSTRIGTSMKSVGEVMSIGRRFEEALQKALRMVNPKALGFQSGLTTVTDDELANPSDMRIFAVADAFRSGYTIERVWELTKIDRWFLSKLKKISDMETALSALPSYSAVQRDMLLTAKQIGFSDKFVAKCTNTTELVIRKMSHDMGVRPCVKQIDTVAAEYPATNNYLYYTYSGIEDDVPRGFGGKESVMVLGSGAYCIGSSVEFDWCAVTCIRALNKLGYKTIMVNFNPETVSTDYDECDKLYFEELSFERVVDIYEREQPVGVVVSMGGQIPNNISGALARANVRILGTTADMIDAAENRYKFSRLLDTIGVNQPKWKECRNLTETAAFCSSVGYPCLVRPSFVLSGAGMTVIYSEKELDQFLGQAANVSADYPVVISKFITAAKEIDVDAVAQGGHVVVRSIAEHIENAGVHSGDASLVLPAQDLDAQTVAKVNAATDQIAQALCVSGPMNIQFIAKDAEILVIECNLRASRSFPFVSKTLLVNFAEAATMALLGRPLAPINIDLAAIPHIGVKVPQFSFTRLQGADPILGVEMASTGEVACFGTNKYEAYLKALTASGFRYPTHGNVLLSIGSYKDKAEFLPYARKLAAMGYRLFATPGTADFLTEDGVRCTLMQWPDEAAADTVDIAKLLQGNTIDLCIILPSFNHLRRSSSFLSRGYLARRLAIDNYVPLITNIKCAKYTVEALARCPQDMPLQAVDSRTSHACATLPGFVEISAALPHPSDDKDFWATRSAAALAGGFTTLCAMPAIPAVDADTLSMAGFSASQQALCDWGILACMADGNAQAVQRLAPECCGAALLVDENAGDLRAHDVAAWVERLAAWPEWSPVVVRHDSGDARSLSAVLLAAHLADRRVHISAVSTAEELAVVRASKQRGIKVTCSAAVHSLAFCDEDVAEVGAGASRLQPPLARRRDKDALWAGLDVIDCFSAGSLSPEAALSLVCAALRSRKLTTEQVVERLSTKIMSIPEQPESTVEIDLDEEWSIPSGALAVPLAGRKLNGRVLKVTLRGATVYSDGRLTSTQAGKNIAGFRAGAPVVAPAKSSTPASPSGHSSPARALSRNPSVADLSTIGQYKMQVIRDEPSGASTSASASAGASAGDLRESKSLPVLMQSGLVRREAESTKFAKGRSVLSLRGLERQDLHFLWALAEDMRMLLRRSGGAALDMLRGRVMSLVLYSRSTRTAASFHAAMTKLGGSVMTLDRAADNAAAAADDETVEDAVRTVSNFSDVVVLRHPREGTVEAAARASSAPVLSAGSGPVGAAHPTQALVDVFTIRERFGTVNDINVTIVGDLANATAAHSLAQLLSLYRVRMRYVSPPTHRMPRAVFDEVAGRGVEQTEATELAPALEKTDVLYVTRILRRNFASEGEWRAAKRAYRVTLELLSRGKEGMIVMHPQSRADETDPDVDLDPCDVRRVQSENSLYVCMALIAVVLGKI